MTPRSPRSAMRTVAPLLGALIACLVAAVPASAALDATPLPAPQSPAPAATPRIVGGTVLPDTLGAPYTVAVYTSLTADSGEGCSGTILDPTHVLTAAHCFIESDGTKAQPSQVQIVAGSASFAGAASDPGATIVGATAVRTHPRYLPAEFDDDVAVVTLAKPLNFATGRTRALPLPAVNTPLFSSKRFAYTSRAVQLTGFGLSTTNGNDYGTLRKVDVTAIPIGFCQQDKTVSAAGTDAPAILLCSDRAGRGACQGDSGGTAATGPANAPYLAGVIDTSGEACEEGRNLYANVAAPEIRSFIDAALQERDLTAAQTPLSPRGGRSVKLSGDSARVGDTVRCRRGSWRSGSTFKYAFVFVKGSRTERNRGLSSKSTYKLRPSDRGWSVSCAVQASNAGGTGTTFWPYGVKVRSR
jgi:secreted trypsin-like serine protease